MDVPTVEDVNVIGTPTTGRRLGGMSGFLVGASAMFATMYATQAILPTLGQAFGVSPSRAGLTISVLVLALVAGSWIWGPLSDRIGRRRCLLAAAALQIPATVMVAVAPSFELLLAARVLQGLIMPGILVVGLPYVAEVFIPAIGARAMGWYMAALIFGGLVGRLGVALAAAVVGWRWALGALALLPLVAIVVMARGLPTAPPRRAGAREGRLANRRVVAAALCGPSLFFVFVGVFSYIGFRLEAAPFNLSATVAALVFAAWVVGAIAPVAGRRAERHGWSAVALAGAVVATLGVAISVADVLGAVVVGLVLVTLGMFTVVTAAPIGVGTATGVRPGAASAVYYSVYYAAGSLGAFVPGLAWQAAGWNGVVATAGVALVVALAGAALGMVDERGRRRTGRGPRRVRTRPPMIPRPRVTR